MELAAGDVPRVRAGHPRTADPTQQIEALYPANYLAHSSASRSRSIYGRLKAMLGRLSARGVAAHIPRGGAVLEVGCGNGFVSRCCRDVRADIDLAGVDIGDVGVTGVPRLHVLPGPARGGRLRRRRFDVIYCSNLIEHVPDPFLFLEKCLAVLRPGGVIYGITPDHLSSTAMSSADTGPATTTRGTPSSSTTGTSSTSCERAGSSRSRSKARTGSGTCRWPTASSSSRGPRSEARFRRRDRAVPAFRSGR